MEIITEDQLRQLIREKVSEYRGAGRTQKDLADEIGIQPSYLSEIINRKAAISDTVAQYFGRRLVRMYEKEG